MRKVEDLLYQLTYIQGVNEKTGEMIVSDFRGVAEHQEPRQSQDGNSVYVPEVILNSSSIDRYHKERIKWNAGQECVNSRLPYKD